jgi:hypothetical protein
MRNLILLACCGAAIVFAADDPWSKVKAIKSGAELRVFKKGAAQPIVVKMDEATDERLVVVNKNEQTAIAKEDIDRIDARPLSKRPITKESKQSTGDTNMDPRATIPSPQRGQPGITSSSSTSYSLGSKPDFETVYRRPPAAPKQ